MAVQAFSSLLLEGWEGGGGGTGRVADWRVGQSR